MITPERWHTISEILEQALELSPDKRARFLDLACSSDPSLRSEVQSLLSAHEESAPGVLDRPPLRSSALIPGTMLGDYEIVSHLGEGGMGVVYRARDIRLNRPVAVKVIRDHMLSDTGKLRRFEQEAHAAAAINHPNIVAVHQFGTYQGAPYLVSELLEGETLRAQLKRGPFSQSRATDFAEQIAEGLCAAHQRGIIHRDLKPENLFVSREQRVKILDFGLAKLREPGQDTAGKEGSTEFHTNPGNAAGTVGYASPEQLRGEKLDARTDLFSFGVILYEMVTGQRPFAAETSGAIFEATLNRHPAPPRELSPAVSAEFERIILKALEKDREFRYQGAAEIRADLKRLKRNAESSRTETQNAEAQPGRLTKGKAIRGWKLAGLMGLALVILTGIWFESAAIRQWISMRPNTPFSSVHADNDAPHVNSSRTAGNLGAPSAIALAASNTWTQGTRMPYSVSAASAVTLGGKIYVIGGKNGSATARYTQIYDPVTDSWRLGAPIPTASQGSAGVAFGNYIYIFGGDDGIKGYEDKVYQYNPETNVWTQKTSMPTARSAAAAAVIDGRIYVVGGDAPTAYWVPNLESYDPVSDTWTVLAPMTIGQANLSAAAFGRKLVVSAGYSAMGGMNGSTMIYDTTTNAWSSAAHSQGIDGACSGVVLGRFYVFGGGVFGGAGVNTTQIYDPTANKWTSGAPMRRVNSQAAGAVYNGKIYCFGGANTTESTATYNTVEIYTP